MNVQTAIEEFLLACRADGLRSTTVDWYRSLLSAFDKRHGELELEQVTTKHIRRYIADLRDQDWHWIHSGKTKKAGPLSDDTIHAYIRSLHKFWKWCVAEYKIINPMESIRYPRKTDPKPRAIDMDDLEKMYASNGDDIIGVRNRALLAFLIDTGCRAGGLLTVRPEEINLERRRAYVTEKGGRTRAIVFSPLTVEVLTEWMSQRQRATTLFYNFETLKPLTVSGLRGIMRRMAKRAKVTGRVNPHSFRHGFAREYLGARGDLATLSKLMGHRDVTTTIRHYTIFTEDEIAEKHDLYSPINRLRKNKDALD